MIFKDKTVLRWYSDVFIKNKVAFTWESIACNFFYKALWFRWID